VKVVIPGGLGIKAEPFSMTAELENPVNGHRDEMTRSWINRVLPSLEQRGFEKRQTAKG